MHKTMRSFVLFLARKGLTEAKEKKKRKNVLFRMSVHRGFFQTFG